MFALELCFLAPVVSTLMERMQDQAAAMRQSHEAGATVRRKATERRFLETEAGEEDEHGELRRNVDNDDDEEV